MNVSEAAAKIAAEFEAAGRWNYDTIECKLYDALREAFERLAFLTDDDQ